MIGKSFKWLLKPQKNKLPPYMIFFVTSKCNSRCKTCFNWKNLNRKDDLSLEEIKRISKNMHELAWLHLSGGEPFLRNDLPEICTVFFENNNAKNIAIPTNCLLPEKIYKTTKKILSECRDINLSILLSLDGLEKTHCSIRGVKGNFQKVLETEKKLRKLKKEFPQLSTMVCTVVCNKNYSEMGALMDFVRDEMDVDFHTIEIIRGNPKNPKLKPPTVKQMEKLFAEYKENLKAYSSMDKRYYKNSFFMKSLYPLMAFKINSLLNKIQLETLRQKKQVIPCLAGKVAGVINSDGSLSLCELLPSIGNLRKANYDFSSVWFSKKAEKQRKMIEGKGCYCTHCLFQVRNIIFNPKLYFKVLTA